MTRPSPPGSDPEVMLVELDARGRLSLARLVGITDRRRYLAQVHTDGTIVLTPAAVVPATTPARKQR